jgi:hypothetical protein
MQYIAILPLNLSLIPKTDLAPGAEQGGPIGSDGGGLVYGDIVKVYEQAQGLDRYRLMSGRYSFFTMDTVMILIRGLI